MALIPFPLEHLPSPSLLIIALVSILSYAKAIENSNEEFCRVFPGDSDWPDEAAWAHLNDTVGGALIKPVPHAAVCHSSWPQYDAEKCAELLGTWGNLEMKVSHPTDIVYPYFQGSTCLPTTNASSPCTIGGSPEYVVNVTYPFQISAAIRFAKKKNIRLIIKNTGHDVNGKSTAAGALSIWTFNMKNISFIPNYSGGEYTGPALKVGAGISLETFYKTAKENEVTVVGGECSTVGVAGGYISGGGHSPITGLFGMGADQVIALEAVLPDGSVAQIDKFTNPELFWAFRGGGGSTFGVVTSVTVRAYPKIPITVSFFSFATSPDISDETFWRGVRLYFDHMPTIADSGSQGYPYIRKTGSPPALGFNFLMSSFFAPNMTIAQYEEMMQPLFTKLELIGIEIQRNNSYYENYYDAWTVAFPKIVGSYTPYGTAIGSRLLPRANWENITLLDQTFQTLKEITYLDNAVLMYTQKNNKPPGVDNAVNPAYRKSLAFVITGLSYPLNGTAEEINEVKNNITDIVVPKLKAISPGSGTYLNEADAREQDFQHSYYGSNYGRLLRVKQNIDPDGIFYAPTAVGSEFWYFKNDIPLPDVQMGRLCRNMKSTVPQGITQY